MNLAHPGSSGRGMKTPLINTIGNRMTAAIMFAVAGRFVGGTEKMFPRAEKHSEASA